MSDNEIADVIDDALERGDIIHIPDARYDVNRKQYPFMPAWGDYDDAYGCVTIGGTKTGKTFACRYMITGWLDFDTLIVCCVVMHEREYQKLRQWCMDEADRRNQLNEEIDKHNRHLSPSSKFRKQPLQPFRYLFVDKLTDLPNVDTAFNEGAPEVLGSDGEPLLLPQYKSRRTYVIIDDMANKTNQKMVDEYYIKCRKFNSSIEYISQSWKDAPNMVKKNAYVFRLHRGLNSQQITMLHSKIPTELSLDQFKSAYKIATTVDQDDIDKANEAALRMGEPPVDPVKIRPFLMIDNTADFGKRIKKWVNRIIEFED